ncbi:lipopolysaccharide biosynthesis protein [Vibrio cholerae]|uniref:lipopolysaccharide biosynthesis protein n=1 Tax=Vibrio cholerae TaxID=666 RepID=UPI00115BB978|nr:lipopolysaccharide biosynthesis protein [Vibrio cholerae]TQP87560.1 lipopolysaccharide biosynthesis protein [Vibrio cholerae]
MIKNKLVQNILIYGGVTGLSRMLPILLLPFYLSALSIEEFGRIEVLVALYNIIIIFGSMQLETAVQRYMYKVEDKANYTLALSIVVFILSTLAFFVVAISSKKISNFLFGSDIEYVNIIIISICSVLFNVSTILLIYFRYAEQEKIFSLITLSQVVVTAVITYALVVVKPFGNLGYVLGMSSGWLTVIISSALLIYYKNNSIRPDFSIIRKSVDFSWPQLPARFGSFFVQFGNRFIALSYFGAQTVAILGLATKFAAFFQLIYIAFNMAWNPYLYKNEHDENLDNKINKTLRIVLVLIIFSSLIIHVLGGWIINVFFDAEYSEVKNIIILAILPSGLLIFKEILETGIKLSGKTKYISYSYFTSVVFTIGFMFLANDLHGLLIASLLGSIVLIICTWYFSEKAYHIKYSRITMSFIIVFLLVIHSSF